VNTNKLVHFVMVFGLLASLSCAAAETAGRVLVAVGDVSVVRGGKELPLSLGSAIESGDALRTGATSNAQVRLSDGGIISMRPQTELHLDEYHFNGQQDGSEKNFFSLIKGGFRTITGLIGKTNRNNYRVDSVVATIGIRGTDYSVMVCAQDCLNADGSKAKDGLYGQVLDGKINVSNRSGGMDLGRSEAFFVADTNTAPQNLIAPPSFFADKLDGQSRNQNRNNTAADQDLSQVAQASLGSDGRSGAIETQAPFALSTNPPYVAAENVDVSGASTVLPDLSVIDIPKNTFAVTVAYAPNGGSYSISEVGDASNFGISGGTLQSYNLYGVWTGTAGSSFADQGGTVVDGSKVNWGRWVDGSVDNTSGYHGVLTGANLPTGVQYMFADANTSDAAVAAKSGFVTYSFADGPRVTDGLGNIGSTLGGSLGIDFTARTVTPNVTYSVGGSAYNISGFSMAIGGSSFSSVDGTANGSGSCTGGSCSTGVPIAYVVMGGNFVGAAARGAITSVSTYVAGVSTAGVGLFVAP